MDLQSILPHAKALPVPDRRELIDELNLSLPDDEEDDDFGLTDEQITMIESRDAEIRANPGIAISLDELIARVRGGR